MSELTRQAEEYVTKLISEGTTDKHTFHNLEHTRYVVDQAKKLAEAEGLSESDQELIELSSWFHDTGYVDGAAAHEQKSAKNAREFLQANGLDEDRMAQVEACILSTVMPQNPSSKLAEVLCDADMSGLASDGFADRSANLRKEREAFGLPVPTLDKWIAAEIAFFSGHRYFTESARKLYADQKTKNIEMLMEKVATTDTNDPKPKKDKKKGKPAKAQSYSRGVETMFRAGARTHINLSSMADSKANIMLSVNAMIVSVALTVLVPKLDSNQHLIIPAVVLIATCLAAMIMATLSTRPVISKGQSSKEDIANKRSNLLFFGNFHSMDLEDYEDGMKMMMEDNDFLYGSLTRDMYFLGKVLNKKYRYLRICYNIFMIGMVASVLAFGIALY